jgi:hypothetical protein
VEDEELTEEDSEPDSDEGDEDNEPDPFGGLAANAEDRQVATMCALMFDWMGMVKATWVSAKEVWAMMAVVCRGASVPVFGRVKQLCKDYLDRRMERIDMCPAGHVAYIDCDHPLLQAPEFQNAHKVL